MCLWLLLSLKSKFCVQLQKVTLRVEYYNGLHSGSLKSSLQIIDLGETDSLKNSLAYYGMEVITNVKVYDKGTLRDFFKLFSVPHGKTK